MNIKDTKMSLESVAILIGIDWFAGMFRTVMNVDVMIGMLVSKKLGELDVDVYNGIKKVEYIVTSAGENNKTELATQIS